MTKIASTSVELVKLSDIACFNPSNLKSNTPKEYEIKYVDIESVNQGRINGFKDMLFKDSPSRARRIVQTNDIIISTVRPYLKAFSKVEDNYDNIICSTGFAVLRVNKGVSSDYVFRYVMSDFFINQLIPKMVGANYPAVSAEDIKECIIPLPIYKEQLQIASVLAEADALIQKRKEAIANLDRLVESVFIEMFGSEYDGGNINVVELGSLITSGPQNGLYKPASEYGNGSPILRIDSFYDGRIKDIESLKLVKVTPEDIEKYSLKEGDIVINRVNSKKFLGKSAIITNLLEPTVYESNMMRFSVDSSADPEYLIFFLQQPFVKRQILSKSRDAVNQSSINQQDVKSIMVYVPEIKLQRQFSVFSRNIDNMKNIMSAQLNKLEENFQSLLHQAFTGRLQFRDSKVDDYALKR